MSRLAVVVLLALVASPAGAQDTDPARRWFGPVEGPYVEPPVDRRVLPPPDPFFEPGPYDEPGYPDEPDPYGAYPGGEPGYGPPPEDFGPPPDRFELPPDDGYDRPPSDDRYPLPPDVEEPLYEPSPRRERPAAPPAGPEMPAPDRDTDVPVVRDPVRPGMAQPPTLSPEVLVDAVNAADFSPDADLGTRVAGKLQQSPLVVKMQILLDRAGFSPGVIDGYYGFNVQKAVAAFEAKMGLRVDGVMDEDAWTLLDMSSLEAVLIPYTITEADVEGPFEPDLPSDYAELAKLSSIAYRGPDEALAERFHMDLDFLRQINPDADFHAPGTTLVVADPGAPARTKVAHVVADKRTKQVIGYDASGAIVVAYPATIGSGDLPSPTGRHVVEAIAPDPDYWYRPDVNFVQGKNTKRLRLPPGPNGPVGSMWIDLSEPTYGIHGTPNPDQIDKGFSHGCVRLTNWDARELASLVGPGVPVDFID